MLSPSQGASLRHLIAFATFAWVLSSPFYALADTKGPVSREEYNSLLRSYSQWVGQVRDLQRKVDKNGKKEGGKDDAVDLNGLDASQAGGPPTAGSAQSSPSFHAYFDLDLTYQPGLFDSLGRPDITFDNYHSFLFFEISPRPNVQFTFDVNPNPRFYELDYQFSPLLQVRLGRIWIPYDDLSPQTPHNMFGGRWNLSRISTVAGSAYLPDIFADLGIGLRSVLLDKPAIKLESDIYLVNGFRSGGRDPISSGAVYPDFLSVGTTDNNNDKALGGRFSALFWRKLAVGLSLYTCRYSAQNEAPLRLTTYGLDMQAQITPTTELRGGYSVMNVGLEYDPLGFNRAGLYVELGQKFAAQRKWKVLLRGGTVQLDNRALMPTDQTLIGGALVYRPSFIQLSLDYSYDIDHSVAKNNYSLAIARIVVAL
jgi:hypothetical protein